MRPKAYTPPVIPLAYRPKDAALALGVSRSQIYRMIAEGVIKAYKLGGATLIRHDDLSRVLEETAKPITKHDKQG